MSKDEEYPSRPITCIVGFPAGGSVDFVARVIGEKFSVRVGQPFVVENRPGAGGNIAAAVAAKAPPNGYSVYVVSSANALAPFLYRSLQYDPLKDFVYIARWITTSYMLVVRADHPAGNLQQLLEIAQAAGSRSARKARHAASPGRGTMSTRKCACYRCRLRVAPKP